MTDITPAAPATAVLAPRRPVDRHHRGATRWIVLAIIGVFAVLMLIPLAIMLLNSFKSPGDYSTYGPLSWPHDFYVQGVRTFWRRTDFPLKLWNSFLISGLVAVFGTLLSLLNAYALGVGRVRGNMAIVTLFLLANMLPQEVLLYPLYKMAVAVHLDSTPWSVIIIFTVIQAAFGTYLLASVLGTFPQALLEAARLDGASRWDILWRVVYPVVRPTLAVLMIFFFIWTWNEFYIPLIMLTSPDSQTVPIALASLQGDRLMDVPTTNAGALLSIVPTIVFFFLFQRTLTRGVTAGAVK